MSANGQVGQQAKESLAIRLTGREASCVRIERRWLGRILVVTRRGGHI
jgi:hypothetical protein